MTIPNVTPDKWDAVLFDLDGVITASARIHARAWAQAFNEFLGGRGAPFVAKDYEDYVDGKPRFDGAKSFLASRQMTIPDGHAGDAPDAPTIWGIANRKNALYEEALKTERVDVFEGTVAWIRHLRDQGTKIAVVSASQHCQAMLENGGISDLFDARVDGNVATRLDLKGKPAPDTYLKAAEMLGVPAKRAVVVEDALAGVEAGRAGAFGLVIGVDRKHDAEALYTHGADVVVSDLESMLSPS